MYKNKQSRNIYFHIYIIIWNQKAPFQVKSTKRKYLNNGKYGHYLNHDSKNYKVPEWMPVDKLDIDIAERLIEYKKKMSTQWCEGKPTSKDESESESDEKVVAPPKLEIKKKPNK